MENSRAPYIIKKNIYMTVFGKYMKMPFKSAYCLWKFVLKEGTRAIQKLYYQLNPIDVYFLDRPKTIFSWVDFGGVLTEENIHIEVS